jgi:vesicle coat complex subunit
MGCIRVDKITEYLCEPLRKCLKDEDPYVRKTAAVCVAKLHDINASLVEDQGFLDQLKGFFIIFYLILEIFNEIFTENFRTFK